ncbi:MAG: [protein-PII] uridylyltransferase [bacterium]
MKNYIEIKKQFEAEKSILFSDKELLKESFKFCVRYSLLVEELIFNIFKDEQINFALASAGGFSRRELSPFSDIDIMFILQGHNKSDESQIKKFITAMWDCGIEVSHTVRDFPDIKKFMNEDLHAFTQFFETRFIIGNKKTYNDWNEKISSVLTDKTRRKILNEFFEDINLRHEKYGASSKVLEPNLKYSAGGLRDLQVVEWMFSMKNNLLLTDQNEITQTESFLTLLEKKLLVNLKASRRLYESYSYILKIRNLLHIISNRKNDRLEFTDQEKIAGILDYPGNKWHNFMKEYFRSANILNRFAKTMVKRFKEQLNKPISDYLAIEIDDDFNMKGSNITMKKERTLSLSEILRVFYYRGIHDATFDEHLRSLIIERVLELEDSKHPMQSSSVFFREILKLPKNVGKVLASMNELGVLSVFLPEFRELVGFFQPGVYHCYTADEHTLIALQNIESLDISKGHVGKLYEGIRNKDILYLAILFHDIAKPISIGGHEILGAEIAASVMERLNYDADEITMVRFLVQHHLAMEQVAFRRNLNDPVTLNNFSELFPSSFALDLLYLLTYADLSAVNPAVWTQWKSDLLYELYRKTKAMLEDRISGEELLFADSKEILERTNALDNDLLKEHLSSIDDLSYLQQYSQDEINKHVDEIEKGESVSVLFSENQGVTDVTIITMDSESLLSRLCGALSINDLNIHGAKIFTRKDNVVIDTFSVTDFRTHKTVDAARYAKIENDLALAVKNELQIGREFSRVKFKWWRIENKFFKRAGKIKIVFEPHNKYTIIDVFSPDRFGLLYQVTRMMHELGITIYYAKISTKGDDVADAFYVLDKKGKKIPAQNFELIRQEITKSIEELL